MTTWRSTTDGGVQDGVIYETKIGDDKDPRNITTLKRSGGLWFYPDGKMYVYYTPTHYRDITK